MNKCECQKVAAVQAYSFTRRKIQPVNSCDCGASVNTRINETQKVQIEKKKNPF